MRSRILVFGSSWGLIPGCGYDCDPVVAPGGRGSGPWGSLVGWSGGGVSRLSGADGGQCVQGGQHVVEQPGPVSRWWPQDVPAGGSGEPGGDVDQFSAEPGQRAALASAAVVDAGDLLDPVGDGAGDQRRPHPYGVDRAVT